MPLYEYRCTQCAHQFEKIQTYSAPDVKECPLCQSPVERLISAPAVHFSGSGFYQTDYKGKAKSGAAASGSDSGSSASAGSDSSSSSSGPDTSSAGPATPKAPAAGNSSGESSSGGTSSGSGSSSTSGNQGTTSK